MFTYIIAVILSFKLQHKYTFGSNTLEQTPKMFVNFVITASVGCLSTLLFSLLFRAALVLSNSNIGFPDSLAFVFGALLSSLLTYWINKKHVFV